MASFFSKRIFSKFIGSNLPRINTDSHSLNKKTKAIDFLRASVSPW
jgi:hypothetical protein